MTYARSVSLLAVLILAAGINSFAQSSAVRSGSIEAGGFVGASYGIDKLHPMGGGNITYAVNKWILPYFEYSYFPGIGHQSALALSPTVTLTHNYTLPYSDVHGGVHIRIPIAEKPIVPYVVFGLGTIIYPSRTDTFTGTISGQPITQSVPVPGGDDFTINFGGGLRYYMGQSGKVGIRAEAKGYRIMEGAFSGTTFGKVEFGFFYQFR